MNLTRNYKIWLLIAAGLYTIYELVTLKRKQRLFDERDIYNG